jgi:hypothetical protein
VIDGVIGDMNLINPQDVESISVLKRCCFGINLWFKSRNGVILITTKKVNQEQFKVIYNNYFSSQKPSNTIGMVSNYANYMELINEGYRNGDPNAKPIFSQEKLTLAPGRWTGSIEISQYGLGFGPFQNKISQNHNLSFTGGSDKIKFFALWSPQ